MVISISNNQCLYCYDVFDDKMCMRHELYGLSAASAGSLWQSSLGDIKGEEILKPASAVKEGITAEMHQSGRSLQNTGTKTGLRSRDFMMQVHPSHRPVGVHIPKMHLSPQNLYCTMHFLR